ncbi:MAG: hypothetical protein WAN40_06305 [Thermoplasmata archaeon]
MKHRRHATARRVVTIAVPLAALFILLAGSMAFASLFDPGSPGASPTPFASPGAVSAHVVVGASSEATPISPAFWGINIAAAQRFNSVDAASVAATPVNYLLFPAGTLGEEYNYTSGYLTAGNGTQTLATTSTTQFVSSCEQIGCHAILQLPAEINRPGTAAYYANYVVHTLDFQPAYWEIGNDPSGWDHFNVSWSNWATGGGGNTTPLPFANLVHAYIAAVLKVDSSAKFLALGAGMGGKDYSKPWVEELAEVDGKELSGICVHSYIEGGPSNSTDAQLFTNLNGFYSLPDQVLADRSYIESACPNCSHLQVFVTEINAAEHGGYENLLPTFAGTLYLAADIAQGLTLQVTNLDWFAFDSHYAGSWSTEPEKWQSQYYLFSDLATQLKTEMLPTTITGPSTLYGAATYDPSGLALLLVNVNTTRAVQVNLTASEFSPTSALTQYLWVNGTPLPVASTLPAGDVPVLPPLSVVVLEGPAVPPPVTYPVEFDENGLPAGSNWSVSVNGTAHGSSSSTLSLLEPNGTFAFSVKPPTGYEALPANGSFIVSGGPVLESIAFSATPTLDFATTFTETGLPAGTQWSVSVNNSSSETTSTSVAFWETNGSYQFAVGEVPGYTPIPGFGSIAVDGFAVNVTVSFVPIPDIYVATFSEVGLPFGTTWAISAGGTTANASAPFPVLIALTDGTFAFTVGTVPGYNATPATGWVTIAGVGTTVSVTFTVPPTIGSNRIYSVQGGVMVSNGSSVPDLGISLLFRGGTPSVQWLNLTTDSAGRFAASGLNLTGNLSAVSVDSPSYQVAQSSMTRQTADAVNVTVVLNSLVTGAPPGAFTLSTLTLTIIALAGVAAVLNVAVIRAAMRNRRMARYRAYFAKLPQ